MIRFAKWQGTGNDFVVVDATGDRALGDDVATWRSLAPAICDRHYGVGADGILLLREATDAHFEMIVVNQDGSLAEMCGNGLRCAARHWAARPGAPARLTVLTGAGLLEPELLPEGLVRVDMGLPRLSPADIPLSDCTAGEALYEALSGTGLIVSCVSMGNPHAVAFVPDLERVAFAELGPAVSTHSRFPRGANAGFAQVLSANELRLKVWERGAGPTLACGTGACAAVVAGILTDRLSSPVLVHLPGGELEIEWSPGGPVFMTGPAEPVFEGELDLSRFAASSIPLPL